MKQIIAILAALLLALAGCGKAEKGTEKKESSTPVQSREEAPSSESRPATEKTLPVFQPPVLEDPPFGLEDGEGSPSEAVPGADLPERHPGKDLRCRQQDPRNWTTSSPSGAFPL